MRYNHSNMDGNPPNLSEDSDSHEESAKKEDFRIREIPS